ncbi:MAG: DUF4398 domain-containing protein [Methylomonas sp.]|jgi:predicted S18 family serine protease
MKNFYPIRLIQTLCERSILGAAVFVFIPGCASTPAPTEQIAESKMAVTDAASAGGAEYAPVQLKTAIEKMDAAERSMGEKDYLSARRLAEQAKVDAQLASVTARSAKAQKAALQLQEDNSVLRQEMDRKTQ